MTPEQIEEMETWPVLTAVEEYHLKKRRQGWRCRIGGKHSGSCPLIPLWWRHPIIAWQHRSPSDEGDVSFVTVIYVAVLILAALALARYIGWW